jgi:HD-GYP domain-containing protein (c-di-GMP phosphodiesterase class II)
MTSDRPYRKKWSFEQALKEIEKNAGKQFDPQVVRAFRSVVADGSLMRLLAKKKKSVGRLPQR